ncbi:hypothetical protein FZEAL_2706 [Fusarium zealandicum]|uniref:Uncharacterized protein n=1 Tax=Fusarium zealandicum TaxID=1053134 RepID=A0A8H4XMI9_9HYPO|nr:hypothetical protein FZEAL_2706 [Fusarium zealandicum]
MTPTTHLVTLPYELRHGIYKHKQVYTCCSIAVETKDLPPALNTIHFSPVYRQSWSTWAGRFDHQLECYALIQDELRLRLQDSITPAMYSQIAHGSGALLNYHNPLENRLGPTGLIRNLDDLFDLEVERRYPDLKRGLTIAFTLSRIARKNVWGFAEQVNKALPELGDSHEPEEFFNLRF